MALTNFTLDRSRVTQVGVPLLLGLVGCLLPALTITTLNTQIEPVTTTGRLWAAADLARRLEPTEMPIFYAGAGGGADADALGPWLNTVSVGLTLQQIGVVVGVLTLVALLMDEINKFVFWPLHLAGWVLVVAVVPLWLGAARLQGLGVELRLGWAWLPLLAAGVTVVVLTLRARSRIDTYAGA